MSTNNISPPKYGDHYLDLYCYPSMHQMMLKDKVRTRTYYNAICHNRHLFKGKNVMDVGCGTGILSLFAAKAGARRVIGIESSGIAVCAKQITIDNKFDHIITILHCKLEDVMELPDGIEKVDIIISEFMGYSLFWEGMTETVLLARDRWLKPDGLIFPDKFQLFAVGVWDPIQKRELVDTWKTYTVQCPDKQKKLNPFNPHARNMDTSDLTFDLSLLRDHAISRPVVCYVYSKQCATEPTMLTTLDLNTAQINDLRYIEMPFKLKTTWNGIMHGILTYFDVQFTKCFKLEQFSTAPGNRPTHWNQMLFFFDEEMRITKGEQITGVVQMAKNKKYDPDIDTAIEIHYNGGWGNNGKKTGFHERNLYHYHLF